MAGVLVSAPVRASRWWAALARPVAPRPWDGLLRGSGAVALAGLIAAAWLPRISDVAVLFALTLLINGPYSPLLLVGYEPVLVVFGRVLPPVLVAAVGTLGMVLVEIVNVRLYDAALHARRLAALPESAAARRAVAWFRRWPFGTIVVCALSPIPFWAARIAAVLAAYPLPRYLTATAIGRFPHLWMYAALGAALPTHGGALLGVALGATVATVALWAIGRRLRRRAVVAPT
jgi:uncharacterized membrane protein YdjX (TVP38/TMEM64 family)